ncbi:serralysin [Sphingomonas sp. BE138]|uniref:M10 family metallopeptidase C-terminal domain-containing protein n=1 Tax=Sphingomonas sp. BE138 TaxID=2817845 RepID=UPI00285E5075|nr:M10 family metallopeptidase C-terminal domain-containing protein [Sphingomonas sp. BE138]MDR6789735.1 serralysin [Sphingomonas sp. BE138]
MAIGTTAAVDQLIQHPEHQTNPLNDTVCTCPACSGVQKDVGKVDPMAGLKLSGEQGSVDYLAGTTAANGKAIWSADQIASYLNRSGTSWVGPNAARQGDSNVREVTFGFHFSQEQLGASGYSYRYEGNVEYLDEYFNFAAFNDAQKGAARLAMSFWDDVVDISFREVNAYQADINFGNLASAPGTQAYARLPSKTVSSDPVVNGDAERIVGDVWVSASQPSNFQLLPGGYGLNTLTHEIGHAIGLSHPGNYNFGPGFAVNYTNGAEYYQDSRNYTIMSYWNPSAIGAGDIDWNTMARAYGGTPMIHDILAVQKMYGADTTTRTGDTVYGFNATAGKTVFDFTVNKAPIVTIWDAGGTDTLDGSGFATDSEINLNPGSLSSMGGVTAEQVRTELTFEKVNANRAALGYDAIARADYDALYAQLLAGTRNLRLTDNVGIAYGAIVENAVGGSGNDVLIGNAVANRLTGGAGTDTASYRDAGAGVQASLLTGRGTAGDARGDIYTGIEGLEGTKFNDVLAGDNGANTLTGGAGADTLIGNGGFDTASYRNAAAAITVSLSTGAGTQGDANGDRLSGIEAVEGSAFDDTIYGSNNADTLTGNAGNDKLYANGGDDTVFGGAGDDVIYGHGGDDWLDGGIGNDQLYGGAGSDQLYGGAGDDYLDGVFGDDVLFGGAGNDVLGGNDGNDILYGGAGNNVLTGGAGADIFRFTDLGTRDRITDFTRGVDLIDLTQLDAKTGGAIDPFAWIGDQAFSKTAGELRFYRVDGMNFLEGDVNGDGVADFSIQTMIRIDQSDILFA